MMKYIHTTDIHWIDKAIKTLSEQPDVDSRTSYIKQKLIEHLSYIGRFKDPHHLVLILSDDNAILGISCYTIHTDHIKIDFVYKTCNLTHIGRSLMANIITTIKPTVVKIDNLAGMTGYKCYTAAAMLCNYTAHPDNNEKNINLVFTFPNPSIANQI